MGYCPADLKPDYLRTQEVGKGTSENKSGIFRINRRADGFAAFFSVIFHKKERGHRVRAPKKFN